MHNSAPERWTGLPLPDDWSAAEKREFVVLARALASRTHRGRSRIAHAKQACLFGDRPSISAAACVLFDLDEQGWSIQVSSKEEVAIRPPAIDSDPHEEKRRVQRQEIIKRDENLNKASVRKFVSEMEQPREFGKQFVSIFSLMRDGTELSESLRKLSEAGISPVLSPKVIDPYIQIVNTGERCEFTGLRIADIWRYFRLTWSNQPTSTPGRTMALLVRDRAADNHPIIGIAALGSSVVQIRERDEWIGWQSEEFLASLSERPTLTMARWIVRRLDELKDGIFIDDLVEDGLYWPALWKSPTTEAISRLQTEAGTRRRDHNRFMRRADFAVAPNDSDIEGWRRRAMSDLFRSKRCQALAELMRNRSDLHEYLYPLPNREGLSRALDEPGGRRAISNIVRRAKAEAAGTEIADLTVCGAIAPYNALLGGKLVSMLAVGPTVVRAYHDRYSSYSSLIASSMAGRPIHRRSNLVFIGTTSLYGSGSSQYNRIRIPADVLDGKGPIEFRELGKSRSFGTSHFSEQTVKMIVQLSAQSRNGVRVNSIFGEGVSPKLRKVRDGFDLLGWPAEDLMKHGRQRIVYGVSLVSNLLPYLMAVEMDPKYLFRQNAGNDVARISEWWMKRWLSKRICSEQVLDAVSMNLLNRPVQHGARVVINKVAESD
jgi:hypothetical protein